MFEQFSLFLINFIFKHIFLLIIWTSYFSSGSNKYCTCDVTYECQYQSVERKLTFVSESSAANHQQQHLGCEVVIPCQQDRGDGRTLKWFYKEQEGSAPILILLEESNGQRRFHQDFRSKMKPSKNWSLVIDSVKEEYKGFYWCEVCQPICLKDQPTHLSVMTDTIKEIQRTSFIPAGTTFTHDCLNKSTNVKWTFEASKVTPKSPARQPQLHFVTFNTTLQIHNVSTENAGNFTCWTLGCKGLWQKLLTINMCVITVHCSEDPSVSCAEVCDIESRKIKPNQTSAKEPDRRTPSVTAAVNESVMCGETRISASINCSTGPENKLNNPTGTQHDRTAVIVGVLAAILFLIFMSLFAYCLRPGLQRVIPAQCCCCGLNGIVEDEGLVVYSSIIIRRPADAGNNISCVSDNDCVYAEINVQK